MLRLLHYHIDNSMIHLFNVYYSALLPRSIFIVLSSYWNITCSFFKSCCYPSYSNQVQLSSLQHSRVETTTTLNYFEISNGLAKLNLRQSGILRQVVLRQIPSPNFTECLVFRSSRVGLGVYSQMIYKRPLCRHHDTEKQTGNGPKRRHI